MTEQTDTTQTGQTVEAINPELVKASEQAAADAAKTATPPTEAPKSNVVPMPTPERLKELADKDQPEVFKAIDAARTTAASMSETLAGILFEHRNVAIFKQVVGLCEQRWREDPANAVEVETFSATTNAWTTESKMPALPNLWLSHRAQFYKMLDGLIPGGKAYRDQRSVMFAKLKDVNPELAAAFEPEPGFLDLKATLADGTFRYTTLKGLRHDLRLAESCAKDVAEIQKAAKAKKDADEKASKKAESDRKVETAKTKIAEGQVFATGGVVPAAFGPEVESALAGFNIELRTLLDLSGAKAEDGGMPVARAAKIIRECGVFLRDMVADWREEQKTGEKKPGAAEKRELERAAG